MATTDGFDTDTTGMVTITRSTIAASSGISTETIGDSGTGIGTTEAAIGTRAIVGMPPMCGAHRGTRIVMAGTTTI